MPKKRNSLLDRLRLAGARAGNQLRNMGLPVGPRARLVYEPGYSGTFHEATGRHAFDPRRATRIVEQLQNARLVGPPMILTPEPVCREDLLRIHTERFLDEIQDPRRLADLFFMRQTELRDVNPLRAFLSQAGGTILALERAIAERIPVFNLGGGFHHAQRDKAEGFCPVNDVAVAVARAQDRGLARRILVVDLDYHQGNGTALIFSGNEDVFTLSVHGQAWSRVMDKRNNLDVELPPGVGDEKYLTAVQRALAYALSIFEPDVAIYVAGADPHVEDTLGDFAVSEQGLLTRDLYVQRTLKEAGVPMAVVLAGGYGPMAWTVPYNFIFSVLTGARIPWVLRPSNIRARFRQVAESLTTSDLQQGKGEITDEDIEDFLSHRTGSGLFMDFYTTQGVETALERYGYLKLLREKGFDKLLLSVDADDPDRQILRVHFDQPDPDHLLIEMVVRYRTLVTPEEAGQDGIDSTFRMLSIEWLLMQDPTAEFTLERRKLPGQNFPGLGIGRWTVEILRMMAERLDCMGLMNIPQHYHNAYLYSKQMLCFIPDDQGYLEALKRDMSKLPLVETSEAIDDGLLRDTDSGESLAWMGKPQVMPVSPALNAYFAHQGYLTAVAEARERYHFHLASVDQ